MNILQKLLGLIGQGNKEYKLSSIIEQLNELAPQLANMPGLDMESVIAKLTAGKDIPGVASNLQLAAGKAKQGGDSDLAKKLMDIGKQLLNL